MYPPKRVAAPAAAPVPLADAKAWLRVTEADEDGMISDLIDAATRRLDGYSGMLGRCLVSQNWSQSYDAFASVLRLPLAPVSAVAAIRWTDSAGTTSTISATNYTLFEDARGAFVRFVDGYAWPADFAARAAVEVEFTAGYGVAADVPADLVLAIKMMVANWFDRREIGEIPLGVSALIAPYRRNLLR